mgnify:CR=1 FL=1
MTVFVHGGYSLHPDVVDAVARRSKATMELFPRINAAAIAHDDTWTIEPTSTCVDSVSPGASVCQSPFFAQATSTFDYWPSTSTPRSALYFGVNVSGMSATRCNSESCSGHGVCVDGGAGYYCNCDAYYSGFTCNAMVTSSYHDNVAPKHGLIAPDNVREAFSAFSAVAVHPKTRAVWAYGGITLTAGVALTSDIVITNPSLQVLSVFNVAATVGVNGTTIAMSNALIPTYSFNTVYFSALQPPPSMDAVAWFSTAGDSLYVYADSPAAPPGIWRLNVATGTWGTAGVNHLASQANYPGGLATYQAVVPPAGDLQPGDTCHPGARQGFAKASVAGSMCIYSGRQVLPGLNGDNDPGDDLWCITTLSATPDDAPWARVAGRTSDATMSPLPVFGLPGEFGLDYTPGPRLGAAATMSLDGQYFFLYGGSLDGGAGLSTVPSPALMADLWVFSRAINQWAYLAGPTTWATPTSPFARNGRQQKSAFSRRNHPSARMHATLNIDYSGLLTVSHGVSYDTSLGTADSEVYSVFVYQLFLTTWAKPYSWAPDHVRGADATASWLWVSDPAQTPSASMPAWSWSARANEGRIGAVAVSLPGSAALRNSDVPSYIYARTGGLTFDTTAPLSPVTTNYPFFQLSNTKEAESGLVLRHDACHSYSICFNGGICHTCARVASFSFPNFTVTCDPTAGRLVAGISDSAYRCVCPDGFYGNDCALGLSSYRPAYLPTPIACLNGAGAGVNLTQPCFCPGGSYGPLCSSLNTAALITSENVPQGPSPRLWGASTVAHNASTALAARLGAQLGDTVVFFAGGATESTAHMQQASDTVTAWLPASRTERVLQKGDVTSAGASNFDSGYIGRHIGSAMVYSPTENVLFIMGGLWTNDGTTRGLYERYWRVPVAVTGLSAEPPQELTPATRRMALGAASLLHNAMEVTAMPQGHNKRTDPAVRPRGYPGARAFASAATVTVSGVEWVYYYGGSRLTGATRPVAETDFLADLWRFPTAQPLNWEYVGCSLSGNYVLPFANYSSTSFPIADLCPQARSRAQLVAVGNVLILSGGMSVHGAMSDMWTFNPVAETWQLLAGRPATTATEAGPQLPQLSSSAGAMHMGTRYDHSCDALPRDFVLYCSGGMTARMVLIDLYRRTAPTEMFPLPLPMMSDTLQLPLSNPRLTSRMFTFIPAAHLLLAGMHQDMILRTLSFALARTPDSRFSVNVQAQAMLVTSEPPDLHTVTFSDGAVTAKVDSAVILDQGDGAVFTFDLSSVSRMQFRITHVGLLVALTVPPLVTGNEDIVVREFLAFTSLGNDTTDVPTAIASTRTRPTVFLDTNGVPYESTLVPQLRIQASPSAAQHTHAASPDLIAYDLMTGAFLLVAGPSGANSFAAGHVLGSSLRSLSTSTSAISPAHADSVLESHEHGAFVARNEGPMTDADGQWTRAATLPALAGHRFVRLPTAGEAGYTLLGGAFTVHTLRETQMNTSLSAEHVFPFDEIMLSDATSTAGVTMMAPLTLLLGEQLPYVAPGTPQIQPTVTSALFTSARTAVDITFSVATQQPRATTAASWANCGLIIAAASLTRFGDGAVCAWSAPAVFTVTLGQSFSLRIGMHSITILGDVVRRGSTLAEGEVPVYVVETILAVQAGALPAIVPMAVIAGPSSVGVCDGLTLSAAGSSNSGGLAFAYIWSATVNGTTSAAFDNYITATYGSPDFGREYTSFQSPFLVPAITLPASLINEMVAPGSSITFSVAVSTWFNSLTVWAASVHRADAYLPLINIAGSKTLSVTRARNVLVNALISRANLCAVETQRIGINYTWTYQPVDKETEPAFTGNLASLRVRAYAMAVRAAPYVFRVEVADKAGVYSYTNWDEVSVLVTAAPLRAALLGGDRVHNREKALTLSASGSRDPDLDPAQGVQRTGLTYLWNCTDAANASSPCFPPGTVLPLVASISYDLTIPESAFVDVAFNTLLFTVTVGVNNTEDTRTAIATTQVELTTVEPTYHVSVSAPAREQLLQQNPVVLTATVTRTDGAPVTDANKPRVLWSCDTRNVNLDENGLVLLQSSSPTADDRMIYTSTLAGEKLVAGIAYTFRLSLFSTSGTPLPTQAQIQDLPVGALPNELVSAHASLTINAPPRSGSCAPVFADSVLKADSGVALTLRCSGWEDDAEDLPLTYHWYAESKRVLRGAVKSNWVEIGMALPQPTLEATLRAGHAIDGYNRSVAVYITDIWGAQTRVDITVEFFDPESDADVVVAAPDVMFSALTISGATAVDIDALFVLLDDAATVADIATMSQTALRITDTLDNAADALTMSDKTGYRAQLLTELRSVATMLTISQDARRAVATLTAHAEGGDTEGGGGGDAAAAANNQFSQNAGYSEVAIELLTQLCADGTQLDRATRTQALHTLVAQTSSLASRDAFLGMSTATADSALVATQVVMDAFAAELAALNHNTTLPVVGSVAANTTEGATLLALRAEAAGVVNAIAQQMNVLAMGSLAQQVVGQDPMLLVFGGLSVLSQAVSTVHAPEAIEARTPTESEGKPRKARVLLPPSLREQTAASLQIVMVMVEDSAIFHLAGMTTESYLNGSQSSPLLVFTVFDRTLSNVTDMTVADGVTVPAQQHLNFTLNGTRSGAYYHAGSPFATLDAAGGEFFTLEVPHPKPTWPDVSFTCEWWKADPSGVGGLWSTTGCKLVSVSSTNTTTTCQCTHLTLFRVRLDFNNFLPKFNTLDIEDFLNLTWANIQAHPLPLITCGVWFGVYLVFAFIAAFIDRHKDARALRHYHGEWSDPQRKQWDAVTGDTSASLPSSAMLNPDAGVERMAFTERWIDLYKHLMKHDHLWLSVMMRYDTNAFSSVGRVTAGFVLVLTGYMINALFFGSSNGGVGFSTIVTSFISAAILIPVGLLIGLLFGRSQQGRLKSAIYGYAEHVAQLQYTNRISEPQYATRNEHRMKRNPVVSDEDERVLLHSIAQVGGWTHGPGNALVPENVRGVRDERELRNQLRLLMHIDYDLFMVWFRESWSFPLGLRLFGFVLLWIYVIVLALLIIVYGIQLDMSNNGNTQMWLQASAISNIIEILALKPASIFVKAFVLLILSFCCCDGKPKGPASKSTPDDNLTVYNALEMFATSCAGNGHKHVATDLALDIAPECDTDVVVVAADFVGTNDNYDDDNYPTLQNSSSNYDDSRDKRSAVAPAAVEMMPVSGDRVKYEAVPLTPSSPVVPAPSPRFTGPALPAAPDAGTDDYHDDTYIGAHNNARSGYDDDWNETHNVEPEVVIPPAAVMAPPPPPAAVAVAPPPLPFGSKSQSARLAVPPPPLSALHTSIALNNGGDSAGETETSPLGHAPAVPALPAPSGGVPVMGTRSALAYQQREASASVSFAGNNSNQTGANAQSSLRVPMPLPSHIKSEYHRQE